MTFPFPSFSPAHVLGTPQPSFANVVVLAGFEGVDGSTTFVDESSYARTLTGNGNAQIDTADKKYGSSSLLLDGTGDWVQAADAAELRIGSGDFCIEAFVKIAATGRIHTISNKRASSSAQEHSLQITTSQTVQWAAFRSGVDVVILGSTTALNTSDWYHVAASRSGALHRLFVNGVLEASGNETNTPTTNTQPLRIGRDGFNTGRDFLGWIDEYRFTKGEPLYTATFAPPSAPHPRS